MAPKKKKTQLKPVARGFATTSVPKKVVETPKEPETPEPQDVPRTSEEQPNGTAQGQDGRTDAAALSEADQALQSLVDKFQDKVEKEVVRTIKVSPPATRHFDSIDLFSGYRTRETVLRDSHPSRPGSWLR